MKESPTDFSDSTGIAQRFEYSSSPKKRIQQKIEFIHTLHTLWLKKTYNATGVLLAHHDQT